MWNSHCKWGTTVCCRLLIPSIVGTIATSVSWTSIPPCVAIVVSSSLHSVERRRRCCKESSVSHTPHFDEREFRYVPVSWKRSPLNNARAIFFKFKARRRSWSNALLKPNSWGGIGMRAWPKRSAGKPATEKQRRNWKRRPRTRFNPTNWRDFLNNNDHSIIERTDRAGH